MSTPPSHNKYNQFQYPPPSSSSSSSSYPSNQPLSSQNYYNTSNYEQSMSFQKPPHQPLQQQQGEATSNSMNPYPPPLQQQQQPPPPPQPPQQHHYMQPQPSQPQQHQTQPPPPVFQYPPPSYQPQQQQQQHPPIHPPPQFQYPQTPPPPPPSMYPQQQYSFSSSTSSSQSISANNMINNNNNNNNMPIFDNSSSNQPNFPSSLPERLQRCVLCQPLHADMTEMEIKITFSYFGCVEKILKTDLENGFLIVFNDQNAANSAIDRQRVIIHGHDIQISSVSIQHDSCLQRNQELFHQSSNTRDLNHNNKPKTKNPPCPTVWVGNLPHHVLSSLSVADQTLRPHFERFGTVESIRCLTQRGCAFVNFTQETEASNSIEALSSEGLTIDGSPVKLDFGKKSQSSSTVHENKSAPPPAPPPSDPNLKHKIDTAVQFYLKNGPQFEQNLKNTQGNNPKISFLFPGDPHHDYYRYQIYCQSSEGNQQSQEETTNPLLDKTHFEYNMNNVPIGMVVDTCNELEKQGRNSYDSIDFNTLIQKNNNNNTDETDKEIPSVQERDLENYFESVQKIDPNALRKS